MRPSVARQVSKSELFCLAAVYAFVLLLPLCLLIEAWRIKPLPHASSIAVIKWLALNGIVSFLNQYAGLSVLDVMSSPLSRTFLHPYLCHATILMKPIVVTVLLSTIALRCSSKRDEACGRDHDRNDLYGTAGQSVAHVWRGPLSPR